MCHGIGAEFQNIDLGDERLNQRATGLIEELAADPQASINASCAGWDDTMGAYRFFDNPRIEAEKILDAHRQSTEARFDGQPVVLIVQDTTELDYSKHPTKDSRVLNGENRFGLYDHSHLALTPDRLCLGVLDVDFFDREPESLGQTRERRSDPIETKESFRWLEGYRLACDLAGRHPDTQIVSVSDSESDIYDIFLEVAKQETPADYVIRAKQNRRSPELDTEAGGKTYRKVQDEVASSKLIATRQVDLPKTPKRDARTATLEIRAKRVRVKPPHERDTLGEVEYNVVLVEEVGRPADDETAVRWLLMTTLPIDSPEAVLRVVDYYVARWAIEIFFRVFKTGCRVEEIQLETNDRLKRCLMFYKVIAWRLMYLTYLGRECPELPCDKMFAEEEWKPVWRIVTKQPLPATAPPLSQFIPLVAQLGGYNARSQDPPPGPQSLWIGLRRMTDFALAWQAFGPDVTAGDGL